MGVPHGDPFETNFTTGQRNIFRQSWQRRADASLTKELPIHDQYTLRYDFDVYNITNTTSFDIPQNNVNQNQAFNNVPRYAVRLDIRAGGADQPEVARPIRMAPAASTTAPRVLASPSTPSAARARFRCRCTWISEFRFSRKRTRAAPNRAAFCFALVKRGRPILATLSCRRVGASLQSLYDRTARGPSALFARRSQPEPPGLRNWLNRASRAQRKCRPQHVPLAGCRRGPARKRLALKPCRLAFASGGAIRRWPPALWGLPISVKDCFDLAGSPTTCGVHFYRDLNGTAARDSWLVEQLRAAGAVIVGKTHLHALAYGITGENPEFGDCVQPRDSGALTGGSSSGASASVQEGSAVAAIGTDTGGSVRVPAALCGLAGYRATLGRGDWRGGAHLAESFDTMGWLFRDLEDAPLLAVSLCSRSKTRNKTIHPLCFPRATTFSTIATRMVAEGFRSVIRELRALGLAGPLHRSRVVGGIGRNLRATSSVGGGRDSTPATSTAASLPFAIA